MVLMPGCAAATLLLAVPIAAALGASISGSVNDTSGNPVDNVRIDHTGARVVVTPPNIPAADGIRTDDKGHFHVVTNGPAIVVRKPGYVSQRLRVTGDAELQITLVRIRSTSLCKLVEQPIFKTKDANDVDYAAKWYYVETVSGPQGIISGRGPSYSWGAPDDLKVWASLEYTEFMDENGVIDASGRSADGTYWRMRTIFGAAAQYYRQTRETADQLDCVMDQIPAPQTRGR